MAAHFGKKSLFYQGEEKLIETWAVEKGINKHTLKRRINSGWSAERALTTP